jgi:hypothetical protein
MFFQSKTKQASIPTEKECNAVGGRIISGMGCVVGADGTPVSKSDLPAAEVEAFCKKDGSRYEPALNVCIEK